DGALVGGLGQKGSTKLRAVERPVGAVATTLVGIVGMLDLDDVGAQHRQLVGRKRSRQHVRDVDHPDAFERSRHRCLPLRCHYLIIQGSYRGGQSGKNSTLERFPVILNHLCGVMPALVASIHVFLVALQHARRGWPGTSPAMTLEAWFNMTGTCSRRI